jgi:peptide deformylase
MALLEILKFPDERLRRKAESVEVVDAAIKRLVDDMFETMYAAPGIGLAATQVNVLKRIVVIDVSETKDQPLCLINPQILDCSGTVEREEGCLSVPGVFATVRRAEKVKVLALDYMGKPFEIHAEGLLAICIQHEIDHLDGKLFLDYLSPLKRQWVRKKLTKQARKSQEPAAVA